MAPVTKREEATLCFIDHGEKILHATAIPHGSITKNIVLDVVWAVDLAYIHVSFLLWPGEVIDGLNSSPAEA
ncbi:hypothetical protein [Variovorax sp. 38R]|uniref:hypothetical protein n=1 Tax=Variovorax sp. 38R TaxID=2774875 RepID=UPI001CE07A65|nr:hypothetical protein [Variovorax sp. 38R]